MKSKSLLLTIAVLLGLRITATAQTPPSYVPTDGLVGWWPFNGNANDESGNGNNGIVNGGISNTEDRFGNSNAAFLFDGTSGYIDVPSLNNLPYTPITYSAWVIVNSYFPSSFGHKFRSIIGRNTAFVGDNGVIGFYANNDANGGAYDNNFLMWRGASQSGIAPVTGVVPTLNTWIHISYTQNSQGEWNWYQNGLLTNSGIFNDAQNQFNYFQIGSCNNYTVTEGPFWNDKLDDIGIWNRALTTDEIQALYNGCNVLPTNIAGDLTPFTLATSDYMCNNTPGNTYDWTVTNGVITAGQGTNAITVLWGEEGAGTLSVIETNSEGCSGTPATIDIEIACATTATALSGPVGPSELTPITYSCDGTAGSTYLWSITNGVISSGQGTNTITVLWASTGLGSLSVQETTSANCSGDLITLDVVVIPTAVMEESAIGFSLYPNPAQQVLNVAADPTCIGKAYSVFTSTGRVVLTGKINSSNSTLSLETLAAGNYTLRIEGMQPKPFEVVK